MRTSNAVVSLGLIGLAFGFSPAASFDGTRTPEMAPVTAPLPPGRVAPLGTVPVPPQHGAGRSGAQRRSTRCGHAVRRVALRQPDAARGQGRSGPAGARIRRRARRARRDLEARPHLCRRRRRRHRREAGVRIFPQPDQGARLRSARHAACALCRQCVRDARPLLPEGNSRRRRQAGSGRGARHVPARGVLFRRSGSAVSGRPHVSRRRRHAEGRGAGVALAAARGRHGSAQRAGVARRHAVQGQGRVAAGGDGTVLADGRQGCGRQGRRRAGRQVDHRHLFRAFAQATEDERVLAHSYPRSAGWEAARV